MWRAYCSVMRIMRHVKTLMLLGYAFAAPLVAQATPTSGSIVSMELTGVTGTALGGYYTSPYFASVGPSGLTSASQFTSSNSFSTMIFCDDFLTDVGVGLIWQATATDMSALSGISSPLSTLKFDTTGTASRQQQAYMAEAWLAEDILGVNQSTSAGQTKAAELSYAMWDIFDPSGALSGLTSAERSAALADVSSAYSHIAGDNPNDFSNVYIFTPNPTGASQEYLVVDPFPALVPEPATLSLLGRAWREWVLPLGAAARAPPSATADAQTPASSRAFSIYRVWLMGRGDPQRNPHSKAAVPTAEHLSDRDCPAVRG